MVPGDSPPWPKISRNSVPTLPGSRGTASSQQPKISHCQTGGSGSYGREWDVHLPAASQVNDLLMAASRWCFSTFYRWRNEKYEIYELKWEGLETLMCWWIDNAETGERRRKQQKFQPCPSQVKIRRLRIWSSDRSYGKPNWDAKFRVYA